MGKDKHKLAQDAEEIQGLSALDLYMRQRDLTSVMDASGRVKAEAHRGLKAIRDELKRREETLEKSSKRAISEHAMLRYLQRFKGLDLEALEAEITQLYEGSRRLADLSTSRAEAVYMAHGDVVFVKAEDKIATVLTMNMYRNMERNQCDTTST